MKKIGRYCIWGHAIAVFVVLGCDTSESTKLGSEREPQDGSRSDDETDAGRRVELFERDSMIPQVDFFEADSAVDGGQKDAGCVLITINHDPEWKCTEEQLAELETGGSVTSGQAIGIGRPQGPVDLEVDASLEVKDCDGLAQLRRPQLLTSYQSSIDSNRLSILRQRCVGTTSYRWVDSEGNDAPTCAWVRPVDASAADGGSFYGGGGMGGTATAATDESGANEYTTTNNQVADVDEADFVKNDSGTIYIASQDTIHVIDAWPAAATHEVATATLPGEVRRLFLKDDRLVAYSRISDFTRPNVGYGYDSSSSADCTYGYDCRFSSDGGHTLIVVFDVSEPSRPIELARYEMSGAFVAARRVDQYVYTVVHDSGLISLPGIDVSLTARDPDELESVYAQRKRDLEKAVNDVPTAAFLPWLPSKRVPHNPGSNSIAAIMLSLERRLRELISCPW